MTNTRALSKAVTGMVVAAVLATAAIALLAVGSDTSSALPSVFSADLTTQFGVSGYTAKKIADAVSSPWSMALSLVLVPAGLGAAALTIRATWAGLVAKLGAKAAKGAMITF
ncbi:hypothetical protein C6N75_08390 [Streptomyces solincola]|uniref:Uncharacterized protein n=1 Tax=Streptomyces solincola TaxID=2100817 RepID=A0A2S9PZ63_9ACTN|nr:hypothetical protein [Streptomyces solincola]PRH79647.1 hypothetical protein C6N75_08390 [Streptomyces solincola]